MSCITSAPFRDGAAAPAAGGAARYGRAVGRRGRGADGGGAPERRGARTVRWLVAVVVTAALVAACGDSTTTTPTPVGPASDRLATLAVDDRPDPPVAYEREAWSHWDDVDGDGCDARQEALVAWATSAPLVDERRCKVLSGSWVSPFDGAVADVPADVSIDHLVPLAEAHRSGGWEWSVEEKQAFANDPLELVPTSVEANQAKGSSTPDEWRPERREAWCPYAERWVAVKDDYELSVTGAERRALIEMLATCTDTAERWPGG